MPLKRLQSPSPPLSLRTLGQWQGIMAPRAVSRAACQPGHASSTARDPALRTTLHTSPAAAATTSPVKPGGRRGGSEEEGRNSSSTAASDSPLPLLMIPPFPSLPPSLPPFLYPTPTPPLAASVAVTTAAVIPPPYSRCCRHCYRRGACERGGGRREGGREEGREGAGKGGDEVV